jgi:hypothetical protein
MNHDGEPSKVGFDDDHSAHEYIVGLLLNLDRFASGLKNSVYKDDGRKKSDLIVESA